MPSSGGWYVPRTGCDRNLSSPPHDPALTGVRGHGGFRRRVIAPFGLHGDPLFVRHGLHVGLILGAHPYFGPWSGWTSMAPWAPSALERVVLRDRAIAAVVPFSLSAIAWWYLVRQAPGAGGSATDAAMAGMVGALLILAGAYQWLPVQSACLSRCRSPGRLAGLALAGWGAWMLVGPLRRRPYAARA